MQKVYVIRNDEGAITGLSAEPGGGTEDLDVDSREVQDFLRKLDVDLVRVLEDVIELLIGHGVFRFTDLPPSAQQKLLFRKNLRSQWRAVPDPIGNEEEGLF